MIPFFKTDKPAATEKEDESTNPSEPNAVVMSSPLMLITAFLQALTTADKDGRIVVSKQGKREDSNWIPSGLAMSSSLFFGKSKTP